MFGEERRIVVHFKDQDPDGIDLKQPTGSSEQSYHEQISRYVHAKSDRQKGSILRKIELFWPHSFLQVILTLLLLFFLSAHLYL